MTGQLLLQKAPNPLEEVEHGCIGWQPEGEYASLLGGPPRAHRRRAVVADIVQHHHQVLLRPCPGHPLQEDGEVAPVLFGGHLPDYAPGGIVQRAVDGDALIGTSGWDPYRLTPALPDLCQVGMGVEVALIHIDKPESGTGRCPLFCSSASTCLAEATASASWRWVKSCRGRR